MKILLTCLYTLLCVFVWGQEYTLTTFQSEYKEIDNYNSRQRESLGNLQETKTFELNFLFPYFDNYYDEITLIENGILSLPDEDDFSIRLLTFGYDWDSVLDIDSIPSDIRYKDTIVDGKNALVIQFTRMRLISDPSIDEFDSHISFQYWLYDDGTIELVIGTYNLDNSPVYVPGEGFYLLTPQGEIPIGPELALYHPTDTGRRYSYEDMESYENYILRNDDLGALNWLPPTGWTFRFSNELVNTTDEEYGQETSIYPNPVSNVLNIESSNHINEAIIMNNQGSIVLRTTNITSIDVADLPSGFYTVILISDDGLDKHKLIKI
ncbi:MAG: hypothetical protein ACI86M_000056 [Saprospiraceae bacterium]|jgi:hypothetical protein